MGVAAPLASSASAEAHEPSTTPRCGSSLQEMGREMRIIVRRDTAENWERVNPVLDDLEPALDLTNDVMKLGDGVRTWNELPAYSKSNGIERSIRELTDYGPEGCL